MAYGVGLLRDRSISFFGVAQKRACPYARSVLARASKNSPACLSNHNALFRALLHHLFGWIEKSRIRDSYMYIYMAFRVCMLGKCWDIGYNRDAG